MNRKKEKEIEKLLELIGGVEDDELDPSTADPVTFKEAVRKDNSCGKRCYPSMASVKKAIHNRLNKGANTSKLRGYFCPECASFHMTSSIHK